MKRIIFGLMLVLLVMSVFSFSKILPVSAEGTIYIRADGSIDPPTPLVFTLDNIVYTFTGNISDSIAVERDSVVVDGAGYTLQGPGGMDTSRGISLVGRTNVTVQNVEIRNFYFGIVLSTFSDYNNIQGNDIKDGYQAILLNWSSNYNTINGNNVTANVEYGIISLACSNTISGNTITDNSVGIGFYSSNYNNVSGNKITNNYIGIGFEYGGSLSSSNYNNIADNDITGSRTYGISISSSSSGNMFYHNSFANGQQVSLLPGYTNVWDAGYPSGGNYWTDYTGVDIDGDGIGDTPYVINGTSQDNYPLRSLYEYWRNPIIGDVNRDGSVNMRDIGLICSRFGRIPVTLAEKNCDLNADNIINMRDIGIACSNFGKHV